MLIITTEHGSLLLDDELEYLVPRIRVAPAKPERSDGPRAWVGNEYLARIVLGIEGLPAAAAWADHIDGDTLNNQRGNLRVVTPSQNSWNQRLHENNTSGHKGVSWDKKTQKWEVRVKAHSVSRFGGRYDELADAVEAARELREQLHGRFARHS